MRKSCRARKPLLGVMPLFMRCASACLLLLVSSLSHALSLGEAQIESRLNEPLRGTIPVFSASASELGSLRVGLAGQQDWQRAGLSPTGVVNRIKFGFKSTGGGKLAVTLRTEEPVSEPLLVILVDAAWSSGHLLREYIVFLDPAGLPKTNTSPIATPQIAAPAPSASSSAATPAGKRSVNPFLVSNALSTGQYGPVRRGESLSTISEGIFLGTDLSMHQVVWALYKANPQAFVRGNINHLEVGAQLKVPSEAEMLALPSPQARELVLQAARMQRPPPGVFADASESVANAESSGQSTDKSASERVDDAPTDAAADDRVAEAPIAQSARQSDDQSAQKSNEDAGPESSRNKAESTTDQAALASAGTDKLELLPLEADPEAGLDVGAETTSQAQTADSNQNRNLAQAGADPAAAASGSDDSNDTARAEPGSRERQLENENALLRNRIDETEALLKEIRALLAARSEQLSDLQARLDKVEQTKVETAQAQQSQAVSVSDIGWFWWLLLAVALVIALLLVVLLFVLTRRQDRGVNRSALSYDESDDVSEQATTLPATPIAAVAAVADDKAEPAAVADKASQNDVDDEVEAFIEKNLIMPKAAASEATGSTADTAPVPPLVAEEVETEAETAPEASTVGADVDVGEDIAAVESQSLASDVDGGVERRLPAEDTPLEFNLDDYAAANNDSELPVGEPAIELPELDDAMDSGAEGVDTNLPPILNEAELENLEIESQLAEPGQGLADITIDESVEPVEATQFEHPQIDDVPADDLTLETAELDDSPSADAPEESSDLSPSAASSATDVSEFSGGDQVATKLDLARVYVDMGDAEEARSILNEVLAQGNDAQQQEAQSLLDSLA